MKNWLKVGKGLNNTESLSEDYILSSLTRAKRLLNGSKFYLAFVGLKMKIYFLNMGNSSISGGFSSYSRFISELQVDNQIIKFSDFGTKDKNSINVFFRTVGLEKFNLISSILHKINQMTYVMVFIGFVSCLLMLKL